MKNNPILLVTGEPNSIFLEIFFKSLRYKKFKSPLILISSLNLINLQMKKLKFKMAIKKLHPLKLDKYNLDNNSINVIDIEYKPDQAFEKISKKSNLFIKKSFDIAFKIIKLGVTNKLINGPISKKYFLSKKFLGITEYLEKKSNSEGSAMLIYNPKLSVCPVTTHLPIKFVAKEISKKNITKKIFLINSFYKNNFNKTPRIAILGLNPHCESIDKFNEDEKILKPTIKYLSKLKFKIKGPYSADTIFLKNNRKNFDVIVGMYHDQVLTPLKTLYEYDAINITLGLPFIRISPDHGPNEKMLGKNQSDPLSLIKAISFMDKN